jgi:hypothetical protein
MVIVRAIMFFMLLSMSVNIQVRAETQSYSVVQRGNKAIIIRNGVEYDLVIPRAGAQLGWQDAVESWSSLVDNANRLACMFTLGNFGGREPLRFAMEGVLSKSHSSVDQVAPAGYSATIFQPVSVFDPKLVYTPLQITSQIDFLARKRESAIFRDYSALFLFEVKRDCSLSFSLVSKFPYVVDFVPIGERLDVGAVGADIGAKFRFGMDVTRMMMNLSRR